MGRTENVGDQSQCRRDDGAPMRLKDRREQSMLDVEKTVVLDMLLPHLMTVVSQT